MSASPDPEPTDQELERLLDDYGQRMHNMGETDDSAAPYGLSRRDWTRRAEWSRAALLAHIAAQYVRRDDPRYRILDRANERIRRLRDDDRQHTLHLDDAGNVVSGVPDFEGER